MGAAVMNVNKVVDYSTGEKYVDLHQRIYVPDVQWSTLEEYLEVRDWDSVSALLRECAPPSVASTIDSMLKSRSLAEG